MKTTINQAKRKKYCNYLFITLLIAMVLTGAPAYAGSLPNTFTAGNTAKSSEVNANFSYLLDRSWELSGSDLYYNAGNVGIGMSNPQQKLSVAGTIESTSGGFKFPDGTTQTTAVSGSGGSSVWSTSGNDIYYNSGNVGIGTTNLTSKLEIKGSGNTHNTSSLSIMDSDGNSTFFVKDNGTVGIGTTFTPDEFVVGMPNGGHAGIVGLVGSINDPISYTGTMTVGIRHHSDSPANIRFVNDGYDNGHIRFYTAAGSGTKSEKIRITNTGNVGIGTTNPQGTLDVNGSIYQRGSQIHADYVFEPDYKIEPIEEHAQFMWKEKHLKAVPKARKDENGRDIVEYGSHMKGMLEELEKAHVYISQLNEIINKQQKTMDMLSEKVDVLVEQKR